LDREPLLRNCWPVTTKEKYGDLLKMVNAFILLGMITKSLDGTRSGEFVMQWLL
jgi:hypothetical protein